MNVTKHNRALEKLLDLSIILTILGAVFFFAGVVSQRVQLVALDVPINIYSGISVAEKTLQGAFFVCSFLVPAALMLTTLILVFQRMAPGPFMSARDYVVGRFKEHPYFLTLLAVPIAAAAVNGIAHINASVHPGFDKVPLVVRVETESFSLESSETMRLGILASSGGRTYIVKCVGDEVTFLSLKSDAITTMELEESDSMTMCESP